jgi:hypothetical protein
LFQFLEQPPPRLSGRFLLIFRASWQIPTRQELNENNECRSASPKGNAGWKRYEK